ncbi:Chitinase 2 [Rhizina undulata]
MKSGSIMGVALLATSFFGLASAAWNATKNNNLVIYWGQNAHGSYNSTDDKQQNDLLYYCQDSNVDGVPYRENYQANETLLLEVIPIGFLNTFNSTGGQPIVNFANSCKDWQKFPGTDLLWCPTIAADITTCQETYGKKILLSIGGGSDTYQGFNTSDDAAAFAEKVWDMFGKGWTYYRPFGDAIVDGFDLDIETDPSPNYEHFAYRLRKLMDTDTAATGKQWLLTAAPQCPNPDTRLTTALQNVAFDAIFVQFYNNPSCSANTWVSGKDQSTNSGFNFGMWDTWVRSSTGSKNKSIKILITFTASSNIAAAGGYVSRTVAAQIVADLVKYANFGGAGMWDASEAWANTGYVAALKTALNAGVTTTTAKLKRSKIDFLNHIRSHRKF